MSISSVVGAASLAVFAGASVSIVALDAVSLVRKALLSKHLQEVIELSKVSETASTVGNFPQLLDDVLLSVVAVSGLASIINLVAMIMREDVCVPVLKTRVIRAH